MQVSHDRTIIIRDGDDIRHQRVINSDPNQPTFLCEMGAEYWSVYNCVSEGGRGVILRGSHGVARRVFSFGAAKGGIEVRESVGTDVPAEGYANDITVDEFVVEGCGLSGIHGMGPVIGMNISNGVVRDAGQDAVTQYDYRSDLVRVTNVDCKGFGNHGMHLGGHRAWVVGCTVDQGATYLNKASGVFMANRPGEPKMDLAYVGGGTFINVPGMRSALWARDIKRLVCDGWVERMSKNVEIIEGVDSHLHDRS